MYKRNTKNAQNNEEKKMVYFDMAENVATVTNVRKISETFISFTLKCKGFSLYSLRAVERKDDNGWFISVPATKGKDGNYYNNYALYLRDEDQEAIIDTVFKILEG